MKSRFLFPLLLLLAAVLLSGCSGGYQTSSWPGISVSDQTIYMASGQQIFAINAANGLELWRYPEKASATIHFYAAPVLTPDGQLIVGDYGHTLYSLDPQTGLENWRFEESKYGFIASPLVTEKGIFASTNGGNLYALNFEGQVMWNKSLDSQHSVWAQPVADADCNCIYVASMDHHIYALDAETGEKMWATDDLGGSIVGQPALSEDGILYTGTFGEQIVALNKDTGLPATDPFTTDGWVWSGPALADEKLYFGDQVGNFYLLDTKDGLTPASKVEGTEAIISTPLVLTDTVYVTTQGGSLLLFGRDGALKGKQKFDGQLLGPAVAAGDLILLAPLNSDYMLIAVNAQGVQQWTFVPEKKK
jgi:eukaryotic-like serine/threonine-protein kinase